MTTNLPSRLCLIRAALLAAALVALAPLGRTEQAAADKAADTPVVPIVSTDQMVQAELRALDKFLEVNPQIEETLRTNLALMEQEGFKAQYPAWKELVQRRPGVVRALRVEQRFLLHRAFARLARTPLLRAEIAQFDTFLDKNADVARELHRKPALVRDPAFLTAHPALGDFLEKHPALSTALLTPAPARSGPPAGKAPKKSP